MSPAANDNNQNNPLLMFKKHRAWKAICQRVWKDTCEAKAKVATVEAEDHRAKATFGTPEYNQETTTRVAGQLEQLRANAELLELCFELVAREERRAQRALEATRVVRPMATDDVA